MVASGEELRLLSCSASGNQPSLVTPPAVGAARGYLLSWLSRSAVDGEARELVRGDVGDVMDLNDPRWSQLKGGYRVFYDPRPELGRLESNDDAEAAWAELWQELFFPSGRRRRGVVCGRS
jgi:hypothetical protein